MFTSVRLAALVTERFEKMFAMCPDLVVQTEGQDSTVAKFDKTALIKKLSPLSSTRAKTLLAPTKQSLADYEKSMTSIEQSVRKALLQLDKTSDCLEAQEEQRKAHEERRGILKTRMH